MSKLLSKVLTVFVGFFMAASVMAATQTETKPMPVKVVKKTTVVIVASSNKDFSTLVNAIKEADLAKALSGKGPFTVFAPNNAAFSALPAGELNKLLKNKRELRNVIAYHVVPGKITSNELKDGQLKTLNGKTLTIEKASDGSITVNGAKVVQSDIMAGNGVIYVVDSVLMPPKAAMKLKKAEHNAHKQHMASQHHSARHAAKHEAAAQQQHAADNNAAMQQHAANQNAAENAAQQQNSAN